MIELEITTDPSKAPSDCTTKVEVEETGGIKYTWYMDVHEMFNPERKNN